LSGCGASKAKLEPEQFKSRMENEGFEIKDASKEMNYDYIIKIYVAKKTNYNIEYYNIIDEDYAAIFYQNNVEFINNNIVGDDTLVFEENGSNYSKYTVVYDGRYKLVSRIDNTVIFLNVSDRYKDDIDNLIGKLGY
jgi:hypothetical protein